MEEAKVISWRDLGCPKEPGTIKVKDLGVVQVSAEDIERASQLGDDCKLELIDVTATKDIVPVFAIGQFIP